MPTTTTEYRVADAEAVLLDVWIGDAQAGGSVAYLGTRRVAAGRTIRDRELGPGEELRGRVLVVSTTVVDVQPSHDRTSVTVRLRGGTPAELPIVQSSSAAPGGAVNYLTVVRML